MLRRIWTDFISLILRRPAIYQVAALCWRQGPKGVEILLITSLTTGRWILPKGWPKMGLSGGATALEEAWEEAGLRLEGRSAKKVGSYRYQKRLRGDVPVPARVDVYAVKTPPLLDDYPEAGKRRREWFAPHEAADLVDEPDLARLLRDSAEYLGK